MKRASGKSIERPKNYFMYKKTKKKEQQSRGKIDVSGDMSRLVLCCWFGQVRGLQNNTAFHKSDTYRQQP